MKKSVLFVCLGNICRSPAAETIFLSLLHEKGEENNYIVDSAGTGAWHVGKKADSRMRACAKKRGLLITTRARQISLDDFEKFDLILTMDNDNLNTVISLKPQSSKRNKALVKPVLTYSSKNNLSEVPDPYYGGENGFENVLDLLEDACNGLLKELNESH